MGRLLLRCPCCSPRPAQLMPSHGTHDAARRVRQSARIAHDAAHTVQHAARTAAHDGTLCKPLRVGYRNLRYAELSYMPEIAHLAVAHALQCMGAWFARHCRG